MQDYTKMSYDKIVLCLKTFDVSIEYPLRNLNSITLTCCYTIWIVICMRKFGKRLKFKSNVP